MIIRLLQDCYMTAMTLTTCYDCCVTRLLHVGNGRVKACNSCIWWHQILFTMLSEVWLVCCISPRLNSWLYMAVSCISGFFCNTRASMNGVMVCVYWPTHLHVKKTNKQTQCNQSYTPAKNVVNGLEACSIRKTDLNSRDFDVIQVLHVSVSYQ